jgi:hypothetical protein
VQQSRSEAKKVYHVREAHCEYANILFPDSYQKPLDYTCAILPIYHGAMVYFKDDIVELSVHIKTHDPKYRQLKALKPRIEAKEELEFGLQLLKNDQKVIKHLTKTFAAVSLPADKGTIQQLLRVHTQCESEYVRFVPNFGYSFAVKRVFRWFMHLRPSALSEYCNETVTDNKDGTKTHRLRVQAIATHQGQKRETFWFMLVRYNQGSQSVTEFRPCDRETFASMKHYDPPTATQNDIIVLED